ncbi:hypothetical protein V8C34DRAFT_276656 [Trichoderma compactum]
MSWMLLSAGSATSYKNSPSPPELVKTKGFFVICFIACSYVLRNAYAWRHFLFVSTGLWCCALVLARTVAHSQWPPERHIQNQIRNTWAEVGKNHSLY